MKIVNTLVFDESHVRVYRKGGKICVELTRPLEDGKLDDDTIFDEAMTALWSNVDMDTSVIPG